MRPKLTLVAGKADKAEIRIKLPTIVGRTRNAGLMIGHKTVSRRHCELFERQGMLIVRDTGSRNGTLVDNVPIKEAMLKPGHTLTIGPLTFRADYEPVDAFIRGDEPGSPNGTAQTMPDAGSLKAPPANDAAQKLAAAAAETPTSGKVEFEDVELQGAADADLQSPTEVEEGLTIAVPDGKSAPSPAAAAEDVDFDDALVLDEADLGFDELTDTAPNAAPSAAEPEGSAPSVAKDVAAKSADDKPPAAPRSEEGIGDIGAGDEFLSFELDDDLAAMPSAEPAMELDDIDLAAAISDEPAGPSKAPEKQTAPTGDLDLDFDDAGFTLEDLEGAPAEAEPPVTENRGDEEMLEFEIEEPEPPQVAGKAAASAGAAKKSPPNDKVASKNAPVKNTTKPGSAGGRVPLGEEKPAGGESEMSAFMKELGL